MDNPTFIRGDFTQIVDRLNAESPDYAQNEENQGYEPDLDPGQIEIFLQERSNTLSDASQISQVALYEVVHPEAMIEKAEIFNQINTENFFDSDKFSFIISSLEVKKRNMLEGLSNLDIVDDVIDRMCAAMKAAGVNNQTISTARVTTKTNIENSLSNHGEVPAIPSVAPRKYRGVIQDGPPVEFIRSVYATWVIAEVLDREALDKLDHNLVLAVYSYKKRNPNAPTLKNVLASKSAADSNRRKVYNQAQTSSIVH
jgi:hypothetical protein